MNIIIKTGNSEPFQLTPEQAEELLTSLRGG